MLNQRVSGNSQTIGKANFSCAWSDHAGKHLLKNRTSFTLLRGEMEAEMLGLFLEPRYEMGSYRPQPATISFLLLGGSVPKDQPSRPQPAPIATPNQRSLLGVRSNQAASIENTPRRHVTSRRNNLSAKSCLQTSIGVRRQSDDRKKLHVKAADNT
jgi:hypothetical protein